MKKVVCLVLLTGILLSVFGCRKDVFVDPPPSLRGEYKGIIIRKFEGQAETNQLITWRFDGQAYTMWYDEDNGSGREFCDNQGLYELDGSIVKMETTNGNLTDEVCAEGSNPEGSFAVDHPTIDNDTLKLIQAIEDLTVTIKLVPDIDEEE